MAKKTMADMVPRRIKKNTRHTESIIPKKIEKQEIKKIDERFERLTAHHSNGIHSQNYKKQSHKTMWFVALISLLAVFFAVSSNFSSAKVTLVPKSQIITIDTLLGAVKGTTNGAEIPFEIVTMNGSESTTISGATQKELKLPARGQVVLYNTYSTSPQKLSIDTRLEGSNGKIYKTEREIVIPGMNGAAPGSVEVGVYGFEPGEDYNSGPLDFKIFGFKGTSKYNKFYARSVGDIAGGMSGSFFVVSEEEKNTVSVKLSSALKEKLTKKVLEQVPNDYVLFPGALIYKEVASNIGIAQKQEVTPVTVNGSVYGFLFKKSDLTKYLASTYIKEYAGESVSVTSFEGLVFTFGNQENLSPDIKTFTFKLTGTATLVYDIDIETLTKDLISREKNQFKNILAENKNIDSAELVLRPVWRTKLPEKMSLIKIDIKMPK